MRRWNQSPDPPDVAELREPSNAFDAAYELNPSFVPALVGGALIATIELDRTLTPNFSAAG